MKAPTTDISRKIDVRDLEILLTVAETCSFRKAGDRLNVGQSAVSRRIQKLEELLGVSLFGRRPTGARMTVAGAEFIACASAVYENLNAAVARARSSAIADLGELRIGTMSSFSNGPQRALIKAFVERHPSVRLNFLECERRQMMTMLGHRTLDVVITIGENWKENGDSLVLVYAPVYLAVASDGPLASNDRLKWQDVSEEEFLISARESGPDVRDYIVRQVTGFGRGVSITQHHLCRDGIMNLVGLGFGITVVDDHAAGAKYPNVTLVPIGDGNDRVPFSLTWRPENDNPALRRFISLARIEAKRNGVLS
ncbi:LysR family transcriptional regulator [Jannaschia donghaensis]|uniref:HTH-type transcriptional regulator TdfR n=1 Tax=Jannaschia donghaensis TaxID=420998 RepID=A0A0M6YK68_9RHOB|nr:LysR family transcriptional regulator [Jannaschia donghaensis]CTQ50758.1 HTH-type transcriptional regulator TdfR [Jannaschia donghaensis]